MTIDISDNNPRISYTVASGVTQTSFAVPFEFFDDSDVKVYVNDVLKTITTDYTVSGGGGSTGTITMSVTGPATVVFVRKITIERVTDFPTGIDINRAALNTQLDTLTAITADLEDSINRSVRLSESSTSNAPRLPESDAGKVLAWDGSGNLTNISADIGDIAVDVAAAEAAKVASEAAQSASEVAQANSEAAQSAAETAQAGAETAQVAAELAQSIAETARDAASVNADVYADTAAGLSATIVGDQFQVVSGDEVIRYRHDAGPVATEVARYPTSEILTYIDQIDYGPAFVVADEFNNKIMELTRTGGIRTGSLNIEGSFTSASTETVLFDGSGKLNTSAFSVGPVPTSDEYIWAVSDEKGNAILAVDSSGRLVANFELVPSSGGGTTPVSTSRLYDYSVNQVFGYGQSLSVGQTETALSTTQNYDNLMFTRGMRPQYDYTSETESQWYASLVPAVEEISPLVSSLAETPSMGTADMIKQRILAEDGKAYTDHEYQILISTPGYGARTISQLSKGSDHFTRMVTQATYGRDLSNAAGKTHAVQAVTWTQGESDYISRTTRSAYATALNTLISDINTDLKAVTGQTKNIPLISYQISSHIYYGGQTSATADPYIALAISDVEESNPLCVIATPMYQFSYWAGGHIIAESTRWLGAYYGLAYKRVIINQEDWKPLKPIASVRQSNFVEIRFNVPEGPIVFDTTQIAAQPDYGFQLVDASNNAISISSIDIIDVDRIRITAATTIPSGAKVRYAWQGNTITGLGNLRDSQGDTITFDAISSVKRMDNWCLIFELEV